METSGLRLRWSTRTGERPALLSPELRALTMFSHTEGLWWVVGLQLSFLPHTLFPGGKRQCTLYLDSLSSGASKLMKQTLGRVGVLCHQGSRDEDVPIPCAMSASEFHSWFGPGKYRSPFQTRMKADGVSEVQDLPGCVPWPGQGAL